MSLESLQRQNWRGRKTTRTSKHPYAEIIGGVQRPMSCNCDELQGQIKACLPSLRARTLIEAARKRSVSDEAKGDAGDFKEW